MELKPAVRQDFAKGGPIKKVSGKPRGKEDGTIAVQRGEYVVRRIQFKYPAPPKWRR